ncbi:MAG: hypothetical protein K940chlam3_01086, partial [Chlamydiae bacterium]|nr:hypothetical protein [Chlamydiota bacterium]
MNSNQRKFEEVKKLNLPLGQYLIIGSGSLGIRNLREIGDIDILVDEDLWQQLSNKFEVIEEKEIKKIVIPGDLIEIFGEVSFGTKELYSVSERIAQANIIDGLPFESLEHV